MVVRVHRDAVGAGPDVEILIGDSSKFRADTGWEPKIPFDKTLRSDDYLKLSPAGRVPALEVDGITMFGKVCF